MRRRSWIRKSVIEELRKKRLVRTDVNLGLLLPWKEWRVSRRGEKLLKKLV